ncbi:MAG TPA: response regulator transcription factor [Thermoanaerobaculia bacterium]|nr:response regulator transcription factor [Thermoanaerobaculia bacterium]
MTRILLVDDHAVVRQGLRQILEESIPGAVFEDAASAEEAMRKAQAGEWDVAILDLSLPDMSGLEALKELRRSRPGLPVLVLSMHREEQFAVRALRAGRPATWPRRRPPRISSMRSITCWPEADT